MHSKTIYILSLFILTGILFIGCSNSDESPTSNNDPVDDGPENVLIGTWKLNHTQNNDEYGGTDSLRVTVNVDGADNLVDGTIAVYYSWSTDSSYRRVGSDDELSPFLTGRYNADSIAVLNSDGSFQFVGEKSGSDYIGKAAYISTVFYFPDTLIFDATFVSAN